MKCEARRGNVAVLLLGGLALIFAALAGYFYFQTRQDSGNTQVETGSDRNEQVDEMANWKTYTNTTYGYSFKYPADIFKYQDPLLSSEEGIFLSTSAPQGGNGPKFLGQNDLWLNANILTRSYYKTLDEFFDNTKSIYANAQKSQVMIGGTNGNKVVYSMPVSAGNITSYIYQGLVIKGWTYTVILSAWNQNILNQNQKLFDQILSTFKFID